MPDIPQTEEEWLPCLSLPEYLQMIPTGQIRPIFGPIIWIDGNGNHFSTERYIVRYGFDPQLAWDAIKKYRASVGKKDRVVSL